ncbi:MAG: isoleucine--tRNA ligase [Euryarchaeota archaeon RBG_19FT_COMBO_56_21]|nr:MAG: isoleucine--tRNA ligase [Euryarchaeota archaeon RBG_19FT_COMBO_56_21]
MTKYYPEPDGKSFPQMEQEVLLQWEREHLLSKVKGRMEGGRPLVFCEGPPTANAKPHIGHALTRAVKDAFLRYHVMNGRKIVPYIGGWDCHGLPVEIEVERALGIQSKKDIEKLGVDKFNRLCRESVLTYKADWEAMSRRIGYMIDYDNAYLTMSKEYVESVWWSLKQLHEKGLLSKGHKVVPYCPRCGTTLSTHEVALGFRETEGRSIIVKFRLKGLDLTLLAWTATPWALLGNALLAVDRETTYSVIEHSGERLAVAEDRVGLVSLEGNLVGSIKGSELVGKGYEPPFKFYDFSANGWKVVHSPDVAHEEGTGVMSVSPAYGSVDFDLGETEGLEVFDPIDAEGRFTNAVPELKGMFAKDADSEIMRMLESKGLLFKWGLIKHSYPFCWRCDTALIYKAIDSWFVTVQDSKQRIIELNEEVKWVPEAFKHGRFGNFLADAKDWAISRSRYWGVPLPVWRCARNHEVCVGSYDELAKLSGSRLSESFDPHRPSVDSLETHCPECGDPMRREDFVVDCWYDSGCAPFAQYHYPFENIEEFDTHQSVDFIAEGVDQTRGWFYTQLALGTLLFDKPAYMSVLVLGQVLDEHGMKMKRGTDRVVYPDEVFSSVGADSTRLLFLGTPVWHDLQFSVDRVRDEMVGTLTTLLNVYAFFASNANAYGFRPGNEYGRTHDLDRWIVSRLHSSTKECREGFESLEVHRAVRALESFIVDLSNWYVRRSRRRFWEENDPQDRFSAHCTLYDCLVELSKLMAPITPFYSDWMYRNLKGPLESVHLEKYPEPNEDLINGTLERQISLVTTAVMAGRLARQKVNVKLRQPLPEVVIAVDTDKAWTLRRFEKMIAEELNVKRVEVLESREKMIQYAVHPNLKVLGPKLKGGSDEVAQLLSKVNENELVKHLRSKGKIRLGGFTLAEEDVIVSEKEKPGYSHASIDDVHVYVRLEVTQNLKLEGLSREVIRRIQHMRKEQRLEFEDPVAVEYDGHPDLESAISSHKEHIMRETHAKALMRKESPEGAQKWMINKLPLELSVRRSAP